MRTRWVIALFAALLVVVSAAVWITYRDQPQPTPPPVAPVATPAPLPPATGLDGDGIVPGTPANEAQPDGLPVDPEALPADITIQPDPGAAAITVPGEPGVGGEIYVASPAFTGNRRLNAGWNYPSGNPHRGWDVGINRGTKLFAARDSVVVGARNGVPNHPSGSQYAVPGSASNWILLCAKLPVYGYSVLYYQHLSPTVRVEHGQKVTKGQDIGQSGNTGNSTGDHLHLSSSKVPNGWTCNMSQSQADSIRYLYLSNPSKLLFDPSKWWANSGPVKTAVRPAATSIGPVLKPGQQMYAGQTLLSANGKYAAVMQGDGNFVLYDGNKAVWSSKTNRHPGAFVRMQYNGDLVVYQGKTALWRSRTSKFHPGAYTVMQNDRNLVLYQGNKARWNTRTYR